MALSRKQFQDMYRLVRSGADFEMAPDMIQLYWLAHTALRERKKADKPRKRMRLETI